MKMMKNTPNLHFQIINDNNYKHIYYVGTLI